MSAFISARIRFGKDQITKIACRSDEVKCDLQEHIFVLRIAERIAELKCLKVLRFFSELCEAPFFEQDIIVLKL